MCAIVTWGCFSVLNHVFLFNSLYVMGYSRQIMNILFLCSLSAWLRATPNRLVSTKFPTCVIDTLCVWRKWKKMAPY